MNAQEQIKFIVENTDGECWHECKMQECHFSDSKYPEMTSVCHKCQRHIYETNNPSPHDLNELFQFAEKLGGLTDMDFIFFETTTGDNIRVNLIYDVSTVFKGKGCTPAGALRSALVKAIEGKLS